VFVPLLFMNEAQIGAVQQDTSFFCSRIQPSFELLSLREHKTICSSFP
jgi:hypothetical protein